MSRPQPVLASPPAPAPAPDRFVESIVADRDAGAGMDAGMDADKDAGAGKDADKDAGAGAGKDADKDADAGLFAPDLEPAGVSA